MVDVHSTDVLNKVVSDLPDRTTFLVDTFFPGLDVSDEETIIFDTTNGRKLVAPFVSPLMPGRLVADLGYETDSFRPAYVKDRRQFDPKKGRKKLAGEKIGGSMTAMARIQRAIKGNLNEQLDMLNGRFELMAGEILRTGKVTISGERYPTRIVDFKRKAEWDITLTGGDRWGQVGVSPYQSVDTYAQELSDYTGFGATDVIFGKGAWPLFRDSIPDKQLDTTIKNLTMNEVQLGYVNQPRDGVTYRGRLGYLQLWTYTGTYTDPEDGQTKKTIDDFDVIIGSRDIDGVRHYGAIQDFEAGLQAQQYFVKSKLEWDPSRIEYLMQSAPLLVPYRRNNVRRVKVQ
jgi:hypothetical protein